MPKDAVILDLGDRMTLGKYRGEIVGTVARADPQYILWMAGTVGKIQFRPEVLTMATSIMELG
jgi:ribosomal protein L16/L10AE